MKKILFLFTMMFAIVAASHAQVIGNKPFDNIYVGAHVGASTPLTFESVFPVNPMIGIHLGKNVTPVLGFEAEGTLMFGRYNWGQGINWLSSTTVKSVNVNLLATFNMSNMFLGYKGTPRLFEPTVVAGLGWVHYYQNGGDGHNDLLAKTGVRLPFNLGKTKAWQLYAEPTVLWNLSGLGGPVQFNVNKAQFAVFVGTNYKFKTSNGTHNFVKIRPYDQAEVDALNERVNKLQEENAELAKRPEKVIVKEVVKETQVVSVDKNTSANVWFKFGSAELTDEAKAVLDKVSSEKEVTVRGYASSEGPRSYNQKLSERRAQAVADYLKSHGVKVKNVTGCGVAKKALNRTVIVE